jgi:PAS domain S-box-containing protein
LPIGPDRYQALVESIKDYAIFMLDPQGIVRTWNTGARNIKGYAPEEIIGQSFTNFYPSEVVARGWPQQELRMAAQMGRFEDEGWRLRKSGQRFWANVVITALKDEQGQLYGFAKITRDLTDRRRNEELLRESEERFRLLVESVQDSAIYMLDPDGRIESWNTGAQSLKGYSAAEAIGHSFSMFYTAEGRSQGKPALELEEARAKGQATDEGWRVRKDGSVFWAHVTVTCIRDEEGRLRGYAKVTRDMTEQRRVLELEMSARRVSQFLAILGHELRNPLAPMRNAVSIMQMDAGFPPRMHALRDIIGRQVTHLTRLVDDLLDVGRITSGKIVLKRERLVWQDMVRHAVEAAAPLMTASRHELTLDMSPMPLMVWGDPTRLQQVLQNILHNAAKYTPAGGRVHIDVSTRDDMLVTRITDNGEGIAPGLIDRIFELFVQSEDGRHAPDSGLGIGLAMARILLELHGGTVRAESAGPGLGSTFTLLLPLSVDDVSGACDGGSGAQSLSSSSRCPVLVVDDNRDSAETMAVLIEALGYPVRAVFNGEDAVEFARALQPSLILLDLNMPGRDGFDVLTELRALP